MSLHHPLTPGIADVDDLITHLQYALEVEHATIPAYLTMWFSLRPGSNTEVERLLHSVIIDEMLHMVLVSNVLNSVGGSPRLTDPEFVPTYPTTLPLSDGSVTLHRQAFGPAAVEMCKSIERPADVSAPPQADRYHTLGQFYSAIADALTALAANDPHLCSHHPERQVGPNTYVYGSLRDAVVVSDLDSALVALDTIIAQGEGLDGGILQGAGRVHDPDGSLAHWYRFDEIAAGRRYTRSDTARSGPTGTTVRVDFGAVSPVRTDLHLSDLPHGDTRDLCLQANAAYARMLGLLEVGLTGTPAALTDAVAAMSVVRRLGEMLAKVPLGDGSTASMTFELPATRAQDHRTRAQPVQNGNP